MASEVSICNRALAMIGAEPIAALTEDSAGGRACDLLYEPCRDYVFRQMSWNCLTTRASLALLSDSPAFGFDNQFALPSDCLRLVDIVDSNNVSTTYDWSVEGGNVLTNLSTVYAVYIKKETDVAKWDSLLQEAVAAYLSHELAKKMGKDASIIHTAYALYEDKLGEAARVDSQVSSVQVMSPTGWTESRF